LSLKQTSTAASRNRPHSAHAAISQTFYTVVDVLDWHPAVPTLSLIENVCPIMKKESDDGLVSAKIRQIFHLQNCNNSFPNSQMIKSLTILTFFG